MCKINKAFGLCVFCSGKNVPTVIKPFVDCDVSRVYTEGRGCVGLLLAAKSDVCVALQVDQQFGGCDIDRSV